MPEENLRYRANRKHPSITAEQKAAIREEVLGLLTAAPALYLSDLKNHLVTKYQIAKQTAYQWLRDWSIG